MAESIECPACGGELHPDAPQGLCPRCLLEHALSAEGSEPLAHGAYCSSGIRMSSGLNGPSNAFGAHRPASLRGTRDEGGASGPDRDCTAEMIPLYEWGRYQIFGEIARGGMGAILRGRDRDLGRDLAVKVLLEDHRDRPELVRRFLEEARISGQLQHPGVVPIHELGTLGDSRPYFTMKLVEGRDLASLLGERRSATEDWPRLLGIFEQICQTMAYAHSRGVIHCDLKPSNVMVGSFGEVQVMDWGLARVLKRDTGGDDVETRAGGAGPVESIRGDARQDEQGLGAGSVLGTPAYMAPEQARGENSRLDERTDVFGLGAVLCEVLTGEPPFVGRDRAELQRLAVDADLAGAWARLDQSGAEPELIALARRCLAPLPRDRPGDAGAVASAITGHHRGVQEKLRQAELARVEAQAKAADEKMRLRLAVGLAVAIVVLVLTVGFGGARLAWDRQRRSARLELAVRDVELLKLQAELARDDPAKWAAAREAAQRALELRDDARDDATRSRVAELAAEIRKKADENESDIRLLERLAGIREFSDRTDFWQTVGDYAAAFRSVSLDLKRQRPEEVGRSIARRPDRVALAMATAIDDWAVLRYEHGGRELAARLMAAARVADPDPWRGRLRSALLEPRETRLTALRDFARSAPLPELPPATLALLGRALKDVDDPATAESVLRPAQRRHPDDLRLTILLAETLMMRSRQQEATRYYMMARVIRPEAAHPLSHALIELGETDEAIAAFCELARARPWSVVCLSCLGASLRARGLPGQANALFEAAVAIYREAVRRRPEDPQSHVTLGIALCEQGHIGEAIAEYRRALQLGQAETGAHLYLRALQLGHATGTHFYLAATLGRDGRVDDAIAEYREAIRLQPDSVRAWSNLGVLLCEVKHDAGAAAEAFRQAIQLDPENAPAHYNLANALEAKGQDDEAIAEYREAIRLDPGDAQARSNLGVALARRGELDGAIAEYREAIRLNPRYALARVNLGLALASRGELDEAIGECREAVRLRPNNAGIRFNYGATLSKHGKIEEAIVAYREAIRLDPDHSKAHANLGVALARQGKPEEAIAECRAAIRLDPKHAEAHYNLGVALARQGKPEEAIAEYRAAIRLDPKHAEAHCNLGLYLQRRCQYAEALAALRRGHELGSRRAGWNHPSGEWLRDCERMSVLDARLQAIQRGVAAPADAADRLDLGQAAYSRGLHATAARLAQQAFAMEPKRGSDMRTPQRYNAACYAALAGCGAGKDRPAPDEAARATLRQQALEWLEADLAFWSEDVARGSPASRSTARQHLRHWKTDSDLAGVHDRAALARFPEEEQIRWYALWAAVDRLLARSPDAPPRPPPAASGSEVCDAPP
jgi:eukaryotic-like serine/threonine-protein kinase